jgi:hypothetical protein
MSTQHPVRSTAAKSHLKSYHQVPCDKGKESGKPLIKIQIIPDTRIFIWYDNPGDTYQAINAFLY